MAGYLIPILLASFWGAVSGKFHWSYEGRTGPEHWSKFVPACGGKSQSPIDIEPDLTEWKDMGEINFHNGHKGGGIFKLENNGHTVTISSDFKDQLLYGGGLEDLYQPVGFHFHWGADDDVGSEHLVYGEAYPMELHIVNMNIKYKSLKEALLHKDGLAVVAVFYKISQHFNYGIGLLTRNFQSITTPKSSKNIHGFPLNYLLPANNYDFYRYQGSLTTPNCNEVVTWTILKRPVPIGADQLEAFRSLWKNQSGDELVNNFRPPQRLGNRKVYRSFQFHHNAQ